MDIVTIVGNSISLVKRLREISNNIAEAEFKNLLADLTDKLADLKLEAANLKEELATLREENRVLRQTTAPGNDEPVSVQWGCYKFKDQDGLYCTACWDSRRKKSLTNRLNSQRRHCPVCRALIGT